MKIYTIGHSTKTFNQFVDILIKNKIKCLVDVRSYPGSKMVPQFNKKTLDHKLEKYGIKYYHIPELGGRRRISNLHHPSIKSESFSSYAEYMMTDDFKYGLSLLKKIARKCTTAFMCAEVLWWQCHRRMISDRLAYDGWQVYHLGIGKEKTRHDIWDIARLNSKNQIIYDQ